MAEERLQKVLARAGIASRRAAEELITKGRVKVDGRVIDQLGVRVDPRRAKVEVDGNRLMAEPLVYIVLHKPRGVMCTLSDPEGRPTVAELLNAVGVRVVPVGRLDFHTSGALLCTNDGDFSNALAHPRNKAKKVYVAKVQGLVQDDQLLEWRKSIEIDGRATAPAEVRRLRFEGDKTWLELTLREGRNRQVRRLGEATGSLVMRLVRISHAGVNAEDLRPGQWRHLTLDELVALKRDFGVPQRVRSPGTEAWEIQVKSNARVPRVGLAKRVPEDPRARREAPSGKPRPAPARGERREFTGKDRFTRDRVVDPRDVRAAKRPATSSARPERSNARTGAPANARPERSNTRPERSNTRPERSNTRPSAPANTRAERPNARPERSNTRPERGNARPKQRPTRDAAPAGRSASSRDARVSSRRRGT
jgi:23S rRNA pseudouridine2605 synthase